MKILANIISWVFIPLLMPIYGLLVAMYIPSIEASFFQENTLFWMNPGHKFIILIMFSVFSLLAPGLSLLMLKRNNSISNIEVDRREERGIPIIITAVYCLFLGVFLLVKAPNDVLPSSIYALPWGGFCAVVITGIINRFDKISLHATGAGMLFGFLVAYYSRQADFYFEIMVLGILVSGLVMSARVYLGKHNLRQVFLGFLVGFSCVFSALVLFARFFSKI